MLCGVGDLACAPCWVVALPPLPFHLLSHAECPLRRVPSAACHDAAPARTCFARSGTPTAGALVGNKAHTCCRDIGGRDERHNGQGQSMVRARTPRMQGTYAWADAVHSRYRY